MFQDLPFHLVSPPQCEVLLRHAAVPWPGSGILCSATSCLSPPPSVPTAMSRTTSSCQIPPPVAPGQVPTHIVPLSVSGHGQLLGYSYTVLPRPCRGALLPGETVHCIHPLCTYLFFYTQDKQIHKWRNAAGIRQNFPLRPRLNLGFAVKSKGDGDPSPVDPPPSPHMFSVLPPSGRGPAVIGKPGVLLFQSPCSVQREVISGPWRRAGEHGGGRLG